MTSKYDMFESLGKIIFSQGTVGILADATMQFTFDTYQWRLQNELVFLHCDPLILIEYLKIIPDCFVVK